MRLLYADDLQPGSVYDLGHATVTREDVLDFGRRWDPLPIHTDEEAAARSHFRGLIASGVHTLSILQRLTADALFSRAAIIAGRGMGGMRLPAPVHPGDVLHGEVEIREVRPRGPQRSIVLTRGTLTNQSGTLVLDMHGESVWERHPQEAKTPQGTVA
ncbi:MaoC/PaaZ C-terminal domain-containing protein [Streptomyces arenae]|uniref:MaoC/PaaZ C-terminal domain-containing protein n=1 Tax=Streptomyces arenae TaxID=29301 RepID=UPI00265AD461|nr:MaoC/PaaZ C-terminal domain-containing protein [Streptomyces arenae]MCG7207397.1 MaoC family dehydratase N-terminal domain-containing protein [Streptomyces arenae]